MVLNGNFSSINSFNKQKATKFEDFTTLARNMICVFYTNIKYIFMKTFLRTLALLLVVFFSSIELNAQRMNYKTDSGFDIGFGIGGSYQQSDIKNSVGGGFDFTFGHSIYQREKAFFSLDWRFRFLAGTNAAFDHRINDDGTYNNIRYSHFNYDLEFALTLNRLRDRTGIILEWFCRFWS
jgi:hypothetical protein